MFPFILLTRTFQIFHLFLYPSKGLLFFCFLKKRKFAMSRNVEKTKSRWSIGGVKGTDSWIRNLADQICLRAFRAKGVPYSTFSSSYVFDWNNLTVRRRKNRFLTVIRVYKNGKFYFYFESLFSFRSASRREIGRFVRVARSFFFFPFFLSLVLLFPSSRMAKQDSAAGPLGRKHPNGRESR